jgi:NAD(P)-dependent dehydrogenase (short-subunit alcohol dehydrogenase family)
MNNKTVLITGVTGAIGGATALEIAKTGATTILLARNKSKLEALKASIVQQTNNKDIDIIVADLSDITAVKNAAKEFKQKYSHLDALVNVAAVYKKNRALSKDGLEMMFATNHLAPFVLTNELLDLLKQSKPSRVITVAAPSFTKLNFDDLQGENKFSALNSFGGSKMMNMMFTYSLSRKLKDTGVSAMVFHPGAVKTELTNEMPGFLKLIFKILATTPDKAAKMLSALALDPAYNDSNGKFYKFDGKEIKSNDYSHDNTLQEKLWKISEEISKKN